MAAIDRNSGARVTLSRAALLRMQQAGKAAQPKVDPAVVQRSLPPPPASASSSSASSSQATPPMQLQHTRKTLTIISPQVQLIELSPLLQRLTTRKGVFLLRNSNPPPQTDFKGQLAFFDFFAQVAIDRSQEGAGYVYDEPKGCWFLKMVGMTQKEVQALHQELFMSVPDLFSYFYSDQNTLYLKLHLTGENRLQCWGEQVHSLNRRGVEIVGQIDAELEKISTCLSKLPDLLWQKSSATNLVATIKQKQFKEARTFCEEYNESEGGVPTTFVISELNDAINLVARASEQNFLVDDRLRRFYNTQCTNAWETLRCLYFQLQEEFNWKAWRKQHPNENALDFICGQKADREQKERFKRYEGYFASMKAEIEKTLVARLADNKCLDHNKERLTALNAEIYSIESMRPIFKKLTVQRKKIQALFADTLEKLRVKHDMDRSILDEVMHHQSFARAYLKLEQEPSVGSFASLAIQRLINTFQAQDFGPIAMKVYQAQDVTFLEEHNETFGDLIGAVQRNEVQFRTALTKSRRAEIFPLKTFKISDSVADYDPKWLQQIENCWQEECFKNRELVERIALLTEVQEQAVAPLKSNLLQKKKVLETCGMDEFLNPDTGQKVNVEEELKKLYRELGVLGIKERTINNLKNRAITQLQMLRANPQVAQMYNSQRVASAAAAAPPEEEVKV